MLRLLLWRHAKSSSGDAGGSDFDRPLAARGRQGALLMARHMVDNGLIPDLVLCSSALRTRQTLAAMLCAVDGDLDIRVRHGLYDGMEGSDYVAAIRSEGVQAGCLMVIGHNPAIHRTARGLTRDAEGDDDDELLAKLSQGFPTAALAVLEFDMAHWKRLTCGNGRLVSFLTPRDLPDADMRERAD